MSTACSVCTSEHRDSVDKALLTGASTRAVAGQFGLGRNAMARHRAAHVVERLARAEQVAEVASATNLLTELRALRSKAISLLLKAEKDGDYRTALAGVREARATLELLGELQGEIDRKPVVNILVTPEWQQVRSVLLEALRGFPEARTLVSARLLALERTA